MNLLETVVSPAPTFFQKPHLLLHYTSTQTDALLTHLNQQLMELGMPKFQTKVNILLKH
jgi:hypothetical protein